MWDDYGFIRHGRASRTAYGSNAIGTIALSGATIPSGSNIGSFIGDFYMVGGAGVYSFALANNSLFYLFGAELLVKSALAAGTYPVTVTATNSAGSVTQTFNIPVTGTLAAINLSASTVADSATVGTVIGALSVSGGVGSYTFTLTSNPGGLFSISGSSPVVAAALTAGADPITIQANNGSGSIISASFTITVLSSSGQSEPFPIIF